MKLRYLTILFCITLLYTACEKKSNDVVKSNTPTQAIVSPTVTPVITPSVTPTPVPPYTDTFYGNVTEGDWNLSPSWIAASIHVYAYHDVYGQITFSSEYFASQVFDNAQTEIIGNFPVDSTNYYSWSYLYPDAMSTCYNFRLSPDVLVYNCSQSRCADDDILYYVGHRVNH